MTPLLWLLSLLVTTSGQASLTRVCNLQVVVDTLLWRQQMERVVQENITQEAAEVARVTRFQVTSLVSRLVNRANRVLDSYYFNDSKYKLSVRSIQILEDDTCSFKDSYLCGDESLQSLLHKFSQLNHDNFCLSYLFTFRDFPGGSIGLAWTATPSSGGICAKHGLHQREEDGVLVNMSLNTGIVSLSRNQLQVSERVAALTLSHEVGHSFGAPHDSGECVGGGEAGHYLMHDTGSLGLRTNNMELSPCSRGNMTMVVSTRPQCWTVDTSAHGVCGNGIVEGFEACDCGDAEQCSDPCCVPPNDPLGRRGCSLVAGAECSPSEGLCCSSQCRFVTRDTECAPATECARAARCHGRNPICPLPESLPDSTLCEEDSRTCLSGQCVGSVCSKHGKRSCHPKSISDTAAACSPHCMDAEGGCSPLSVSFSAQSECEVGGGYGHCSASGSCQVGAEGEGPGWLVGVAIFLVAYTLASLAVTWVYCRYCRGGTIKPSRLDTTSPVLSAGNSEEYIVDEDS